MTTGRSSSRLSDWASGSRPLETIPSSPEAAENTNDQREAVGQIIARSAIEAHTSHSGPEGGCGAAVGRHGAIKPAGRDETGSPRSASVIRATKPVAVARPSAETVMQTA
jgi:hypothetical protein